MNNIDRVVDTNLKLLDGMREHYGSVDIPVNMLLTLITSNMNKNETVMLVWILILTCGSNRLSVPYDFNEFADMTGIYRGIFTRCFRILSDNNVITMTGDKYKGILHLNTNTNEWLIDFNRELLNDYTMLMDNKR